MKVSDYRTLFMLEDLGLEREMVDSKKVPTTYCLAHDEYF